MSSHRTPGDRRSASGQIIVVMALAIVAVIAGVALVIEAGNAFAQQRITQNGADAAANAGAVVLAERLGGATKTDTDVDTAVDAVIAANLIPTGAGWYTDIQGNLLRSDGTTTTDRTQAAQVGSGININSGAFGAQVAGVHVGTTRPFGATFAGVIGFTQFQASADATAVTGILNGVCPAEAGCGILPVTFPVLISECSPPHNTTAIGGAGPYQLTSYDSRTNGNMSIVPLCTTAPGSVGWLDLGPGNLAQEIVTPTNDAFDVPVWLQTQTGNVNAVEDEINDNYAGKVVLIPMFDGTCRVQPAGTALSDCPNGQEGVGNNTWYHIPKFTAFFLQGAYIQGNNTQQCNSAPGSPFVGGNGSVSCMKGWFVRWITQGPIRSGTVSDTDPTAIGVQLIK